MPGPGPLAFLRGVEWGGDVVTGGALVAFGPALVAFGFGWGRQRAVAVVAAVWAIPLVLLDGLYFGLGVDLPGYCGEPRCDPGPLPLSFALLALPAALALVALGVALRRRSASS